LNEKKESFKNEKSLKLALKIECHVKEFLFEILFSAMLFILSSIADASKRSTTILIYL